MYGVHKVVGGKDVTDTEYIHQSDLKEKKFNNCYFYHYK
jgi:hypothetical protein